MSEQLHSINEVLQDLKTGKPVIIVDDESRENEGDLIIAAEFATQENINFFVKYARGIVCTPMRRESLERQPVLRAVRAHESEALGRQQLKRRGLRRQPVQHR